MDYEIAWHGASWREVPPDTPEQVPVAAVVEPSAPWMIGGRAKGATPASERVWAALGADWTTRHAIAVATGLHEKTVSANLTRLYQRGLLDREKDPARALEGRPMFRYRRSEKPRRAVQMLASLNADLMVAHCPDWTTVARIATEAAVCKETARAYLNEGVTLGVLERRAVKSRGCTGWTWEYRRAQAAERAA